MNNRPNTSGLLPAFVAAAALSFPQPSFSQPGSAAACDCYNPSALVKQVMPTVVNIKVIPEQPIGQANPSSAESAEANAIVGSGFIIDPSGLIVTNRHVVQGARRILVTFSDGRILRASVVAMGSLVDEAVIRVHSDAPLQAVVFGDSDAVTIGERVLAIGDPLGLGGTVTNGIVSGLNRNIRSSPFDDFIQTDAAINHGNSGGPLFDRYGRVIGMNTALESPTSGSVGLGFSLPSNDVKLVAQLLTNGHHEPGWLGLRLQPVAPVVAEAFGVPPDRGAIVAAVVLDGPGSRAGIKTGDVITALDSQPVIDVRAVLRLAAERLAGTVVTLTVWRNHAEQQIEVSLGPWPGLTIERAPPVQMAANPASVPDFGLAPVVLTDPLRSKFGLPPDVSGVLIAGLDMNGASGDADLKVGDVISMVDETPVSTPDQLLGILQTDRAHGEKAAALLVYRTTEVRWVGLPLNGSR